MNFKIIDSKDVPMLKDTLYAALSELPSGKAIEIPKSEIGNRFVIPALMGRASKFFGKRFKMYKGPTSVYLMSQHSPVVSPRGRIKSSAVAPALTSGCFRITSLPMYYTDIVKAAVKKHGKVSIHKRLFRSRLARGSFVHNVRSLGYKVMGTNPGSARIVVS